MDAQSQLATSRNPRIPDLTINRIDHTISRGGKTVEPHHCALPLIERLVELYPRMATYHQLGCATWGEEKASAYGDRLKDRLRVYISMSRKALGELGYGVQSIYGIGYQLIDFARRRQPEAD
jgi:DNA-binding response OmpR family regulator